MKISREVFEWLKENAYLVKNKDYWFFTDFPKEQIPDRLEIPIDGRTWAELQKLKEEIRCKG